MRSLISKSILILLSITYVNVFAATPSENQTEIYFDQIKNDSAKLHEFIFSMPKGGDLHNHESGATYAENLIRYAAADNFCIDTSTFTVTNNSQCKTQNLLNEVIKNPVMYDSIIQAWSMQNFINKKESGHDHFFNTFSKFSAIVGKHTGEILAEIANRAESENESYLELMATIDGNESGRLGKKLGFDSDFSKMRNKLLTSNFKKIIDEMSLYLDKDEKKKISILKCDTKQSETGCHIKIRYIYQVLREQKPEMVFAQLLAGFEAAKNDKRIVGVNMVQPEDGKISMRDYKLHMQMVGYLHKLYPNVHVSLHAGELNNELVPREGLSFHINDAVKIALADRIGHGVDILQEENANSLLDVMSKQHVLVEINLTSNAVILNVQGKNHPLESYMQHHVPVTLSTDDEGISRSNLTTEYEHAVTTFKFDYLTLKYFVRNSLMYSFLSGQSLWLNDGYKEINQNCVNDNFNSDMLSKSCQTFLKTNEKANLQWNLEKRFLYFEKNYR